MDNKKTGKLIAACRKKKNMTQQQLADSLCITNKTVSKWETGQGMPDISILAKLSETLDISIDEILKGETATEKTATDQPLHIPSGEADQKVIYTAKAEMSLSLMKNQWYMINKSIGFTSRLVILIAWILLLATICILYVSKWIYYSRSSVPFYAVVIICIATMYIAKKSYILCAHWQYRNYTNLNGQDKTIVYNFGEEDFQIKTGNSRKVYSYHNIKYILDTNDSLLKKSSNKYTIVFRCQNELFLIDEAGIENADKKRFLHFLYRKSTNAKKVHLYPKSNIRMIAAILLGSIGFLGFMMQVGYLTIGRSYGIEYIHDQLFYLINGATLLLLLISSSVWYRGRKKLILSLCCCCILLMIVNLISMHVAKEKMPETIVSLSDSKKNILVLKQNKNTGKTGIYRNELLWFSRKKDSLPYTANVKKIKMQWLTDDSCTVTYYSQDDGNVHQYIATYGDRGTGISYYHVTAALSNTYCTPKTKNTVWSFANSPTGFTVGMGTRYEEFTYEDCVQFGTLGLVLCKNGIPRYTVILNEDCNVDGGALTDDGGSMTLCLVSMKKTAPVIFSCSTENN